MTNSKDAGHSRAEREVSVLAFRTLPFPIPGPGTQRFAHLCRGLSARGHNVTLVAPDPQEAEETVDAGRTQLIRVQRVRPENRLLARGRRVMRRRVPGLAWRNPQVRLVEEAVVEELARRDYDIIVTTFRPLESFLCARRVHEHSGVPWIADLRDVPGMFEADRWSLRAKLEQRLLRKCCSSASAISTVTEGFAGILDKVLLRQEGAHVVYNGFDGSKISLEPFYAATPDRKFRIGYFGRLGYGYAGRDPELLFLALEKLARGGTDLSQVRVHFRGPGSEYALTVAGRYGLEHLVDCGEQIPHDQALAEMRTCQLLLNLTSPDSRGVVPSKVFEYAAIGKWVLSIPDNGGELEDILLRIGCGMPSGEAGIIAGFIAERLEEWRGRGRVRTPPINHPILKSFSRQNQAKVFAMLVEASVGDDTER